MKTHEYIPIWDAARIGNSHLSPRVVQGKTFGTLIWDYVEEAESYRISSISEAGEMTTIASGLTFNKYNITGLTTGQTYTFLLQYYDGSGYSSADPINYIHYTPGGKYECLPPLAVAVPGDTTVTFTWDAIEGATRYSVVRVENGEIIEGNYRIVDTSYTVENLVNGQTYTFVVQSFNPDVNVKWSTYKDKELYITVTPHA